MASKHKSKKSISKIPPKTAERIVAMSLQHPELGARRLVPLLKKKRISVSTATVQNILRREGLQNREKRLAQIKKHAPKASKPKSKSRKPAAPISDDAAGRICEISLQNPDFGPGRLVPLLGKAGIFLSSSAVYRILKRNDLENRQKRLLKLEVRQTPETPPAPEIQEPEILDAIPEMEPIMAVGEAPAPFFDPVVGTPIPTEDKAPAAAEEPEPIPESAVTAPAKHERPPVRKRPIKTIKKSGHWVFYPLYLLLFILLGYLGLHAVKTIQYARMDTRAIQIDDSVAVGIAAKKVLSAQPLDGYRQIWERNLFNTGSVKQPDSVDKIALAQLAPAKKGLGLELVGTVVADDPRLSRAIIDNRSIRKQEAYREGDNAGEVKIKKILRNNVVITTADGDELLTVEIKESGKSAPSALSKRVGSQTSSARSVAASRRQRVRTSSISLKRDEVLGSFADIGGLMEKMKITPYKSGDEAAGFRIDSIARDSVLRKMGLRSRDVIVGINDETITSPDQASDFFRRLADGGEVTIILKRRHRTRQIKLNIE